MEVSSVRCEVITLLWRMSVMASQLGLPDWTAGQNWQVLQIKPFSHLWSLSSGTMLEGRFLLNDIPQMEVSFGWDDFLMVKLFQI